MGLLWRRGGDLIMQEQINKMSVVTKHLAMVRSPFHYYREIGVRRNILEMIEKVGHKRKNEQTCFRVLTLTPIPIEDSIIKVCEFVLVMLCVYACARTYSYAQGKPVFK